MTFTSNVGSIPCGARRDGVPASRLCLRNGAVLGGRLRGELRRHAQTTGRFASIGVNTAKGLFVLVLVFLSGCAEIFPPPPPDGNPTSQGLSASEPVAGVSLTVQFDPVEVEFSGLSGIGSGVAAAATVSQDGSSVRIYAFSEHPLAADLFRLHWMMEDDAQDPVLVSASAYHPDGSAANGSVTLGPLSADTATTELVTLNLGLSDYAADEDATSVCLAAAYSADEAAYPLGDVDQSSAVDILDVVLAYQNVAGDGLGSSAYNLFHHDLTGDCVYDQTDLEQLFMKAVSSHLAARPVMKPLALTYEDLKEGRVAIVGNAGNEPLPLAAFDAKNLIGSPLATSLDWVIQGQTAVWTVTEEPNDALGTLRATVEGQGAEVAVGNIAILIAGQSNAVGWDPATPAELTEPTPGVYMLGNDYVWKPATEPLDDATGQVDCVSIDTGAATSAGTSIGRALRNGTGDIQGTGRDTYLIPSALGGTQVSPHTKTNCGTSRRIGWNLGSSNLAGTDRTTLFGSSAYRALVSSGERDNPVGNQDPKGGPVSAVYWYQGESDNSTEYLRGAYSGLTEEIFEAYRTHLSSATAAVNPVVLYAQLAPYGCCENDETATEAEVEDLRSHDIAERQRRLESGAYDGVAALSPPTGLSSSVEGAYMVVTHDLPRFDRIHLSAAGQMKLAERVAVAYQEHVLGWDVDGTGPRITALSRSGNTISLTVDRAVSQTTAPGPHGFSDYFTVFWGAPIGTEDYDHQYGGNAIETVDVRVDANDPRRILIEHAPPPGPGALYLRYMRPYEASPNSIYLEDVIRAEGSGLPLPAFGPLKVE